MGVVRDRVVARFVLESVRRWVEWYRGPPEGLGRYILSRVDDYLDRIDLLLAGLLDDLV
ncbi:MAG: hypothetical protein QXO32_09110 [Candidatus Bathyarchaeia archaeon]